jgi:hypothetical protein
MKALKTLALLLTILASALTIALMCPQITDEFPMVKSLGQKVRSLVRSASTHKPAAPVVVMGITPGANLTAAQAQFLEQHRRRHQLLRAALQ